MLELRGCQIGLPRRRPFFRSCNSAYASDPRPSRVELQHRWRCVKTGNRPWLVFAKRTPRLKWLENGSCTLPHEVQAKVGVVCGQLGDTGDTPVSRKNWGVSPPYFGWSSHNVMSLEQVFCRPQRRPSSGGATRPLKPQLESKRSGLADWRILQSFSISMLSCFEVLGMGF